MGVLIWLVSTFTVYIYLVQLYVAHHHDNNNNGHHLSTITTASSWLKSLVSRRDGVVSCYHSHHINASN